MNQDLQWEKLGQDETLIQYSTNKNLVTFVWPDIWPLHELWLPSTGLW